jgi:hypothetical protein
MKPSRPFRLITVFIALFSMLYMQLAVASYTCPGTGMEGGDHARSGVMSAMSAVPDHTTMANCEGMDSAQPGLCHAYAHNPLEKQSLDKPTVPDLQPFVPVGLVLAVYAIDVAARPQQSPPDSIFLTRSTAPPLSIRNCCFRI